MKYTMQEGDRFHAHAPVTGGYAYDGKECSVRADSQGLVIDRMEIPRRKLVGALTEHVGPGETCRVSIMRREGLRSFSTIAIDLPERDAAFELVRALGLASDQSALSIWAPQPAKGFDVAFFVVITLVAFAASAFVAQPMLTYTIDDLTLAIPIFLVPLTAVLLSFRILFRARVTVGMDGVTQRTWRSRRYVPYEKIREVLSEPGGVMLMLVSGEALSIAAFGSLNHELTVGELLYRRIWQAHLAHSDLCKKPSTIDDVYNLGARAWVRNLRENPREKAVSYRAPGRTLPHLEEAVIDPTQTLQVRVGAAIALRAKDGTSAEPRIRAAASASASPKLRVLFEKIAEDASDDELAERIETLM